VLGVLAVLLVLEMPVAFALIGSGTVGLVLLRSPSVAGATLASVPFQAAASYTLSVVPMFILMGLLAAENLADKAGHDLWGINTDYGVYQEGGM
jgi:TRAP-type mannitol/chloroaromatic compound transport system permease large subunit